MANLDPFYIFYYCSLGHVQGLSLFSLVLLLHVTDSRLRTCLVFNCKCTFVSKSMFGKKELYSYFGVKRTFAILQLKTKHALRS